MPTKKEREDAATEAAIQRAAAVAQLKDTATAQRAAIKAKADALKAGGNRG